MIFLYVFNIIWKRYVKYASESWKNNMNQNTVKILQKPTCYWFAIGLNKIHAKILENCLKNDPAINT